MTYVIGPGVTTFPMPGQSQFPHQVFVSQKSSFLLVLDPECQLLGPADTGDSGTKTVSFILDPVISKLAPTMPCPFGVVAVTSSELDSSQTETHSFP